MRKGISEVIAEILLLMITIALAGTMYIYVSGMMRGKVEKTISLLGLSCDINGDILLVASNDGITNISNIAGSGDLKIFMDNSDETGDFYLNGETGATTFIIPPHTSFVLISDNNGAHYANGKHIVLAISPSNAITETIYC